MKSHTVRVVGSSILFLLLGMVAVAPGADKNDGPRKCILVFGAHADDVEEMAGGTFARYIAEGYQGVYVGALNNFSGNRIDKVPGNWDFDTRKSTGAITGSRNMYSVDALETMQLRNEEARCAAAVFGAETIFLDFREPEIWLGRKAVPYGSREFQDYDPPGGKFVNLATRYHADVARVVELLRKYQPEIIITHTLGGEKLDHGGCAYMMYLAFKEAVRKGIPVGKLWMSVNGWLADTDAQKNRRGVPDLQIDVKNYLETKFSALDKHVSQNGGLGQQYVRVRQIQPKEVIEEFITVIDSVASK
jgi:LmbE family N-acetylglucosaminyl deacetylase